MVVMCSECRFECRDNYNLQAHLESHIPRSRRCLACKQIFSSDSTARRHRNTCDKYLSCNSCPRKFVSKRELALHVKKHIETISDAHQICPLCRTRYPPALMNEHLQKDHGIELEEKCTSFENMDEFTKWKNDVELSTRSRYSTRNSRIVKHERKLIFLRCHRDGYSRSRNSVVGNRQRRFKKGSNKTNAYCPARMSLTQNLLTGAVEVKYVTTHVGHDFCLSRLTITDDMKRKIAQKLSSNVSFDEILETSRQETQTSLHRFLTRKDLYNIARDFKLKNVNKGNGLQRGRKEEVNVFLTGDSVQEISVSSNNDGVKVLSHDTELLSGINHPYSNVDDVLTNQTTELPTNMEVLQSKPMMDVTAAAGNEQSYVSEPYIFEEVILYDVTPPDQLYRQALSNEEITARKHILEGQPEEEVQLEVHLNSDDVITVDAHHGDVGVLSKVIVEINNKEIEVSEQRIEAEALDLQDLEAMNTASQEKNLDPLNSKSSVLGLLTNISHSKSYNVQDIVTISPELKQKPNILKRKGASVCVPTARKSDVPLASSRENSSLKVESCTGSNTRKPGIRLDGNEFQSTAVSENAKYLASEFIRLLGRITNQKQIRAVHESLLSLDTVISNLSDSA